MTDAGNGWTNKEITQRVWQAVEDLRRETRAGFDKIETRLDDLEQDRAEGLTGRKIRDTLIQVVTTMLVSSLLVLVLAPQVAK